MADELDPPVVEETTTAEATPEPAAEAPAEAPAEPVAEAAPAEELVAT